MSVAVQVPDYEMKLQLVDAFYDRMRADAREQNIPGTDAEIPESMRRLMAERSGTNIRVIEGFVQSCLMLAARKEEYGEEIAESDIIHIAEQKWPTGQRRITAERIQTVIESNYDISHEDLVGNKRNKEFTEPRHIAIWLTRELTGETLAEIGRQYGGRSHATVKHSIAVIEKAVSEDRGLAERVANLREEIGEA
jgi:chromosomal replication initiator protein